MSRKGQILKICSRIERSLIKKRARSLQEINAFFIDLVGKKIILKEWPLKTRGIFGYTHATEKNIFIFYETDTSREHQLHIVFHELGHIILRHGVRDIPPVEAEKEAEIFAYQMSRVFDRLQEISDIDLINELRGI